MEFYVTEVKIDEICCFVRVKQGDVELGWQGLGDLLAMVLGKPAVLGQYKKEFTVQIEEVSA